MNTNTRAIRLQSGQTLSLDRHRTARVFLTEGEALLQPLASWLGGVMVMGRARRVAAPAELTCAGIQSIQAIGAAKVVVDEKAGGAFGTLKAGWDAMGASLRRARAT